MTCVKYAHGHFRHSNVPPAACGMVRNSIIALQTKLLESNADRMSRRLLALRRENKRIRSELEQLKRERAFALQGPTQAQPTPQV